MNKIIKFLTVLMASISLLSVAQKSDLKQSDRKLDVSDKYKVLKSKLWEQLKKGESALYDNAFDIETYQYTKEDYECLIPYLCQELKEEGYIFPSKEEFTGKVKEIFGRTIDYSTSLKYLYVNMENSKDRKHKYFRTDNSIEIHPMGIFVNKDYRFISQLYAIPEIIEYKTKFPTLYNKEKQININQKNKNGEPLVLSLWKDNQNVKVLNNLKTFIARNKYLINNDTTQLDWLLSQDEDFMKLLIETYDYRKDLKHLKWYNERF